MRSSPPDPGTGPVTRSRFRRQVRPRTERRRIRPRRVRDHPCRVTIARARCVRGPGADVFRCGLYWLAGMAQKEGQRHPGRGRGRSVALIIGALLVVAAVGGVTYAVVARDSSPEAAKSVSVQTPTAPQSTTKTTSIPAEPSIPARPSGSGTKGTPAPRQSFD